MTENYLGEIRLFSFDFAPSGWALCNGAQMNIAQNQALASLLSNIYGGDRKTYFNLPDLRGRTPRQKGRDTDGNIFQIGSAGGAEGVKLSDATSPPHTHGINATKTVGTVGPNGAYLAAAPQVKSGTAIVNPLLYAQPPTDPKQQTTLNSSVLLTTGASEAHPNMQPFAVLNYCIAVAGYYPSHAE